jgi:hypothetical protein
MPRAPSLAIETTTTHAGWGWAATSADGRALLGTYVDDKVALVDSGRISPVKLPARQEGDEVHVIACGERFVQLRHPWEDGTAATAVILDGSSRRTCTIPRPGKGHFIDCWLDGDTLAILVSDGFHIVRGVAVTEVDVRGSRARLAPVRRIHNLDRHVGKGHGELCPQQIMRRDDKLFVLASVGYNVRVLLELIVKAKSFDSRIVVQRRAQSAAFAATGEHAVFFHPSEPARVYGLDGTLLATVSVANAKNLVLSSAAPGTLAFMRRRDLRSRDVVVMTTEAWPRATTGALAELPAGVPRIGDLQVADAAKYPPEPTSYATKTPQPPLAWGAVVGWSLNHDPKARKPSIAHAIVTDQIVNFFAVTARKLRFLFNFDLSAIEDVAIAPARGHVRVTIATPSGRTVLDTTRAFADALAAATAARRPKRRRRA